MVSMPAPGGQDVPRTVVDDHDREWARLPAGARRWDLLAACLGAVQQGTVSQLLREMTRAMDAGARPFEVIAGTPHDRYGARITFELAAPTAATVQAALDLPAHPWGAPDWIGLRVTPDGQAAWKVYHHYARVAARVSLPPGLPASLVPVMAASHDGQQEIYCRLGDAADWDDFVHAIGAALGIGLSGGPILPPRLAATDRGATAGAAADHDAVDRDAAGHIAPYPVCLPRPRARANSFCVSIKLDAVANADSRRHRAWPPHRDVDNVSDVDHPDQVEQVDDAAVHADRVRAVSFFADDRALPDDRAIAEAWSAPMIERDRDAYQAALAGVRALGPKPARGWHAMLAWTLDPRLGWSRAASLRVRP